jgi:hypothetical protein
MAAQASVVRIAPTDARPIIPRNQSNLWTKAERIRDQLYEQFSEGCRRVGLDPLLLKSGPSVFPAWVKFEAWQPQNDRGATERSSVLVVIHPRPYHRFEFEAEVAYTAHGKTRRVARVMPMTEGEVYSLLAHVVHRNAKPRFRRFREAPFQLWRTRNKLEGLRQDLPATLRLFCVVAGLITLGFLPIAVSFWAIAAWLTYLMRRREPFVRNEGKPDTEPRSLVRVDSWQTVLSNLGSDETMVRERFARSLHASLARTGRHHMERVWYWGLDGKEERDQFVLTAGRGIVFCQIYRHGRDLYVGWDGHLNRGQWVEETVASGIDAGTGQPVSVTRVVPGTQPTSEYDLIDLSCLMESIHAQIVRLLKDLIEERKIDQEIDFKIQRAERREVVASGAAAVEAGAGLATRMRKAFARTA